MSSTPTPRVAPPEIERIFQASLFLLIVTGFITLASTGKMDLISLLFVQAALIFKAYSLVRDRPLVISRIVTSWLAVIYVLLFVADYFFYSGRDFIPPAIHLVLFGMCIKLFSIERDRDYVYLAVLSFLMVLSAAILTVDSVFLGAFALFMILAVFSFMAMEMRRSSITAENSTPLTIPGLRTHRSTISPLRRLSSSLLRTTGVMVVAILACSVVLFFTLPRIGGGYLSRRVQRDTISTGFSDSVNLGEIGQIQQSSEVVAHVHIDGDTLGSHQIRLRGTALTIFDGRRWTNPHRGEEVLIPGYGRSFQLSSSGGLEQFRFARGTRPNLVHYRVLLEPVTTNVIFTIPTAQALYGQFREISTDADQVFYSPGREQIATAYEGMSDISLPPPTAFDHLTVVGPISISEQYLQLPSRLDERIPELARKLTDSEHSDFRRALAIESYLKTQFGYTLQLPTQTPADPLADFLFRRRQGHCEYFASSMAVMLRTVGIPSRVITGFRGAQFNEVNANYIVRARDAHAWVEAYIPGAGWTTFDPTPSSDAYAATPWSRLQLYSDAAREFWREWIVNYDAGHQQALTTSSARHTRQGLADLRYWAARRYHSMLRYARVVHHAATHHPEHLLRPSATLLSLLLLLALPIAAIRLWSYWRAASPLKSPTSAASLLYMRMTKRLALSGYPRSSTQTPSEFAESISEESLREAVLRFTVAYERARFGGSASAAANLPGLLDQVRDTLAHS